MQLLKKYSFPLSILFIAVLYYLPFVNLGLDFGDEGYTLYAAKRIFLGEILYKDFFWIYTPGQVVILSFLFKIFSPEVVVGRYYALVLHLGIVLAQTCLCMHFRIPRHISLVVLLSSLAFGLPLMNVPYVVLPAVVCSLIAQYFFMRFLIKKNCLSVIFLGISAALILFFKQNAGVYYYGLISLLLFITVYRFKLGLIHYALFHVVFWIISFAWIYPIFLESNIQGLKEFLEFSFFFRESFLVTYPPITLLFTPLGVFKLIPYYLPVLSALYLMYLYAFTSANRIATIPLLFALVGFGGNMYPGTDLLHLYPFYSSVLVGLSILLYSRLHIKLLFGIVLVNILIGVYLTFFKGHLRYEAPYKDQRVLLRVEHGRGIYTYLSKAKGTQELVTFMKENTDKDDRILVYPFAPMVYFLLDNPNISKDSIFYPSTATMTQELQTELEGRDYHLITIGNYLNDTSYSKFISTQEMIFETEFYRVYRVE